MKILISFFLLVLGSTLWAQELRLSGSDSIDTGLWEKLLLYEGPLSDSLDLYQRTRSIKRELLEEGYFLSVAKLRKVDQHFVLQITSGRKFYAGSLSLEQPDNLIIPQKRPNSLANRTLSSGVLRNFAETELRFLENNSYPFARLKLGDFDISNDSIHARYILNPGPRVQIDSIVIKGFQGFPANFLRYDLNLRAGMGYNEALLQSLPQKSRQVEYLRMTRKPALAFTRSATILYLYLEEVGSNQVDGVIGLNTSEEGEITLNGDFHLRLLNTVKKGESFDLRWRRPDQSIQSLDLNMAAPYLLKTPIGMEVDLNIFRQDSSFVNTSFQGLLKYLLQTGSFLSGGVNLRSSNILGDGSDINSGFNSFSSTLYKLGLEVRRTNRLLVPTRGYRAIAYGITGSRSSNNLSQEQFGLEIMGDYRFNFQRHVIKIGIQSEALFGDNLYLNEIFRIGGLKSLRGFNEQSIFSSAYSIGTLEYRFMVGDYDYLTVFTDVAWSETNTTDLYVRSIFTGIGTGLNFRTGAGLFSLFYALGKDQSQPFDLRTSKVHFGYISRF